MGKKNEVTVTISGCHGSGKTTILCLLARALSDKGVEVECWDDFDMVGKGRRVTNYLCVEKAVYDHPVKIVTKLIEEEEA